MTSYDTTEDLATTPRPHQSAFGPPTSYATDDQSLLKTPTRDSFQTFAEQMPPPDMNPSPSSYDTSARSKPRKGSIVRTGSLRSAHSGGSGNVSASGDAGVQDESDNDSATSDGRPQKKKKGQRFYCTDYPPCNLSFTRSEHLARHIRKHTGERPFQCHCLRRFSRLDNLRQHAQTVHLNEDIPQDSLAATGTRFQRQIRTDRVRAPGGRARASTLGSQGSSQAKGHSRNISTSSIGSASDFGSIDTQRQQQQQGHGQQPPLAMAPPATPSRGLNLDTFGVSPGGPEHPYYLYNTSAGYSSPNSVYSTDPTSPLAHSGLQSPIAMVPRGISYIEPNHVRRMSVPSGQATFQSPSSYGSSLSYMSPFASSNVSSYSNASMMTSPTSSNFSEQQQDLASEADIRRRTWHPGTFGGFEQRPATSGLSYYQTPDAPRPMASTQSAAAQSNVRLPGIDSFRLNTGRSSSGESRLMSPMDVDSHGNLQSLGDQPGESQTGNHAQHQRHPAAVQRRTHQYTKSAPQSLETAAAEMQAFPGESPTTPRKQKRHVWYNGPLQQTQQPLDTHAASTSPGDSNSSDTPHTPGGSLQDYQPAIIHSNGMVEPLPSEIISDPSKVSHVVPTSHSQAMMQPPTQQDYSPSRSRGDMDRLDALVAVATSENQTAAT